MPYLPPEKMAAILADDIFNCIFLNEDDRIPIQISLILNLWTCCIIGKKTFQLEWSWSLLVHFDRSIWLPCFDGAWGESISHKTSYSKIWQSLEGTISEYTVFRSKQYPQVQYDTIISWVRDCARSYIETSGWILKRDQGISSLKRRSLTGIGIQIINLRRSDDRRTFIMGILIPIRRCLLSE